MIFSEWKELAVKTHDKADKTTQAIVARARRVAREARLDPTMPFLHAHNAMCSKSYGKPWPEVNYSLARKVLWLQEKSYEPSRIASRILDRAWKTVEII